MVGNTVIKDKNKADYHVLTDLFRMLLSFFVVLSHFGTNGEVRIWNRSFYMLRVYAVPCFLVLSFYLNARHFFRKDEMWLKKRIKRLLIPHIQWAIIYYVIYSVAGIVLQEYSYGFGCLIWQILTGHGHLNNAMWYQFAIIILTMVLYCFLSGSKERYIDVYIVAGIVVSYFLQYSNINYSIFGKLRYELSYPLGRTIECLPFALGGIMLARWPKLNPKIGAAFCRLLILSVLIIIIGWILPACNGFYYQGLMAMGIAWLLVGAVIYGDSKIKFSPRQKAFCASISRYTFGIYCIHNLVGRLLTSAFQITAPDYIGSFGMCILIYLVSFAICAAVDAIPLKATKLLVN